VLLEKLGVAASFHFLSFWECNEAPDSHCLLVWIPETRLFSSQPLEEAKDQSLDLNICALLSGLDP